MPERLYLEKFGNVHALPILHYRMEFAHLVREAFQAVRPKCIAIELPQTLEAHFLRAVRRLPELSVLSYQVGDQSAFLIIEPADPLIEGARLALENDIPLHLIDIDLDSYPSFAEQLPDSYAIHRIGLGPFYQEVARRYLCIEPADEDLRREAGMAFRLQQLSAANDSVLFICGMAHLERIRTLFAQPQAQPLARTRREGITVWNLHPESCHEVLAEYPFLSAIYEKRRSELPPEPLPGPSLRKSFNAFELILGGKKSIPEEEVLAESVERSARKVGDEGYMPDRQKIMLRLFLEAARHYSQETGDKVHFWQKRAFFKFARNYALVSNMLLPDLFQMLAAARSCLDDNYAYAFFRLAAFYPWQREASDLPTLKLTAAELWSGTRRIRFRPKEQQRAKGRPGGVKLTKRKKELKPGDWLDGFDDPSICSYPPEDLVIEEYGRNLKRIGARQLSEEQSRVEPFTSSMLDGIDMRETIRNLHEGKIYVREHRRLKSGVGSVVVIFDEDREGSRFPYCMTWLGEHEQESDMAFYATPPAGNIVGPGISRCEYGGFLLSYPPRRMSDVWGDVDYRGAVGKGEVLLMAALDYSLEKDVIYVAAKPPRSYMKQLAARMGKRIIYLPLGSLSPVSLKKLRIFHVLYGRDKRETAKDYIW